MKNNPIWTAVSYTPVFVFKWDYSSWELPVLLWELNIYS